MAWKPLICKCYTNPMPQLLALIFVCLILISPPLTYARTTPEDILNAKKEVYNQRVRNYSPTHQQQLTDLNTKINLINQQITQDLEQRVERQGNILIEYLRRHGKLNDETNVARPGSDPIQNAQYYLTYAHEAVAYQAAKVYVFDLTSEANIKRDSTNLISNLQSDISVLNSKVLRSQKLIAAIVKGEWCQV